jgi:hypothetical protein
MMYGTIVLGFFVLGLMTLIFGILLNMKFYWDDYFWLIMMGVIIITFCWVPSVTLYEVYERPVINQQAHNYCISQGYDTFEKWDAIGFFPETYTYVKCKFVDNRQDIQGNLRLN